MSITKTLLVKMFDLTAPTFGLPECLRIPIAADSIESIEKYVGIVSDKIIGRANSINAMHVKPHNHVKISDSQIALWKESNAPFYKAQLHPDMQVWVHVDYDQYRMAYIKFGMPSIPPTHVLDHIQNREAIRLRNYSHIYLRICPISLHVNTNAGVNTGGEGMEKEFARYINSLTEEEKIVVLDSMPKSHIIYADPMDITKMLNVLPGTGNLDGVGNIQNLFYTS